MSPFRLKNIISMRAAYISGGAPRYRRAQRNLSGIVSHQGEGFGQQSILASHFVFLTQSAHSSKSIFSKKPAQVGFSMQTKKG